MTQVRAAAEAGYARYTYRLRVSSTARSALMAEWDRCRWVWNGATRGRSNQVGAARREEIQG
ncbi:RNA-guided endonuclease TnpB family protein, partial [Streptomyces sp. NPDC000851]